MRHRVNKRHFNRDTNARKALLRNLVRALVEEGSIVTTKARAKEVKRLTDRVVARAKKDSVASRRQLHQFFGKRDVVNTLFDKIVPAMGNKESGFVRIKADGLRRGDNSEMVRVEFTAEIKGGLTKEKVVAKAETKKPVAKKAAAPKKAKKTEEK